MTKNYLLALLTIIGSLVSTLHAQFGKPKTEAAMIQEYNTVTPGQTFQIALELTHEPHWHSYFINDGLGNSIVPTVDWTLPNDWKVSDLQFPTPHEFSFSGAKVYGFEGSNYLITEVSAPSTAQVGDSVELKADGSWQVCDSSSCLPPNDKSFTLQLKIGSQAIKNPNFKKVEDYKLTTFPTKDLPRDWKVSVNETPEAITLNIEGTLPDHLQFFEYDRQIDVQSQRSYSKKGNTHTFSGKRNQGNDLGGEAGPKLAQLRGILYSSSAVEGSKNRSFWIEVPFKSTKALAAKTSTLSDETASEEPEGELGVAVILASLLLGGLILNLMPCVFPVIGLKIMGFVQQAGEDTKKIKLHGLAFTAGILLSFLALASALYPFKANTILGAPLQERWVVFVLLVVMLLLALSMAGLFEIGAKATSVGGNLTHKEGVSGSFFSGVLAVVIATPCSAPFLGPAIGVAWKFDGPLFFISLLMMGIGLSLPYITLSFFPSLVNKLPRPGAWMESFKQGISFLLFATVGYLVWVYNDLVGEEGQKGLAIMLGITAIATGGWIYGRWNTPVKAKSTRIKANILALLFLTGGAILAMPPITAIKNSVPDITWQKWSPQKVDDLLAQGHPVYIDFTAKWCLTCQTNKAAAYTAEVRKFMHDNNVATLKADMTKKHPEATKAVHALNRSAIPVNVLYLPENPSPQVTREVLTPDYLLDFLKKQITQ